MTIVTIASRMSDKISIGADIIPIIINFRVPFRFSSRFAIKLTIATIALPLKIDVAKAIYTQTASKKLD
jgi:hypothetical protein